MGRIIKKAEPSDLAEIMQVIEAAKEIMQSVGNMHQWADSYPSKIVILGDMEKGGGYIMEEDEKIIAYFAFLPSPEPTYNHIYDGEWLDDEQSYHVIHRIASYPNAHNVFRDIMDFCFSVERNIRIDTHRDNCIMQYCISKYGFTYCGIIHLANGDERLAYQKFVTLNTASNQRDGGRGKAIAKVKDEL